jgi:hypothetical protein
MNGKPHDHPLTDILLHKIDVYGAEGSRLVRKIAKLCSRSELETWWDERLGWDVEGKDVLPEISKRYEELLKRAEESGWET